MMVSCNKLFQIVPLTPQIKAFINGISGKHFEIRKLTKDCKAKISKANTTIIQNLKILQPLQEKRSDLNKKKSFLKN